MNAPLRHPMVAPQVDVADFVDCCAFQRWFLDEGWISLQVAADNLQLLAESAGYVDTIGQDEVQRIMAAVFAPPQLEPEDEPDAPLVPGEPRPYRTPQATIDAFLWLARDRDADRLTAWLDDHPRDVETLRTIWKRKCTAPAQ